MLGKGMDMLLSKCVACLLKKAGAEARFAEKHDDWWRLTACSVFIRDDVDMALDVMIQSCTASRSRLWHRCADAHAITGVCWHSLSPSPTRTSRCASSSARLCARLLSCGLLPVAG